MTGRLGTMQSCKVLLTNFPVIRTHHSTISGIDSLPGSQQCDGSYHHNHPEEYGKEGKPPETK